MNRPPTGFTAEHQTVMYLPSTGFTAPAPSETLTEMQSQSLPNMPHTSSSNFIPMSTSVPVYAIPSFTTTDPFLVQADTIEQLTYYKYLLQHQPFMRALVMSDPAPALPIARNISAASLENPFGVPMLNPSMLYSPSLTSHDISLLIILQKCILFLHLHHSQQKM
jgi:hypothetical protein